MGSHHTQCIVHAMSINLYIHSFIHSSIHPSMHACIHSFIPMVPIQFWIIHSTHVIPDSVDVILVISRLTCKDSYVSSEK